MLHARQFISCLLFLVFTSFYAKPLIAQNATPLHVHVGIILDLSSPLGKMMQTSIFMALEDFYASKNHTTKIVPHIRNAYNDNVLAASAAFDLLKNVKVHAILGPQRSNQADFVIEMGNKANIPIISPATNPVFSPKESEYFIRAAVSSSFQTKAIAALFEAYNWREVVIIYEDTDAGHGFVPYFIDAMRSINTFVTCRTVISASFSGDQIHQELELLRNMSTRVFVVHMGPLLGARFFSKVKEAGMMSKGYAWITTDLLTSLFDSIDASSAESMHSVVGLKPHIQITSELNNFTTKWIRKFLQENPDIDTIKPSAFVLPNAFVLWAYDSTKAIAMEIEKVVKAPPQFNRTINGEILTSLDDIGTSDTGPSLIKSLRNFTFTGLSGDFSIVEGELQPPPFEIVNIIGSYQKPIGYWSEMNGISRKLEQTDGDTYNTNKDNLEFVLWPGESPNVPKGWQIPVRSDQKLRIVVPAKSGFSEFVYIEENQNTTGPVNPKGFCIDVFKEVMKSMPYDVPYDFYTNDAPIYYDELVKKVKNNQYDAAVGDVTILAHRSDFVDFTLPFTESGLTFVVPIRADERNNPWIFLKPLTKNLWLTTGAFFVLTGIVVWVLEHRVNKEFRGPLHEQVGIIFWFSFSTLVFAHKEKVMSNLARFVVVVWFFVVVVLTSSYQASLTSMLTVQKLQPTVTTISDLLKDGEYIGYQDGSYVPNFLKELGFKCFRNYSTLEEYDDALSKGSINGGVSAIADELPYIKLFLGRYHEKYTIIDPIYETAGFGFVFPKGSPLVADVSRVILKVTEGDQMINITRKWFGDQTDRLENNGTAVAFGSLTLESFRGLFHVAGVTFVLALMIFFVLFIHENRDIVSSKDPLLQKLSKIVKAFDQEKEDPSMARKPPVDTNGGDVTEGIEPHFHAQVSEVWQSHVLSFSDRIDEDFSTPESGSPAHDAISTAERR
ncbi:transmembrane signal receptor [Lithospermum erythrorhizon]|uniref:Glutamate receptor n=1 Tax=Lithospermum erythrorhizon TaxID=34254 RepID=A0AAV3RU14_LITER